MCKRVAGMPTTRAFPLPGLREGKGDSSLDGASLSAYTQSMSIQRETRPTKRITVLHAGSLTTLVRGHLDPALQRAAGISLESVPGHSVALALALKERRLQGDVY